MAPGFNMLDPIKATIITPGLDVDGEFGESLTLYNHAVGIVPPADTTANTGQVLSDMLASELWSFGLPFAETAKDGDVLVAYYSGSKGCMDINIARLRVCR